MSAVTAIHPARLSSSGEVGKVHAEVADDQCQRQHDRGVHGQDLGHIGRLAGLSAPVGVERLRERGSGAVDALGGARRGVEHVGETAPARVGDQRGGGAPENVEGLALGVHGPPQRGEVGAHGSDLGEETGVGAQREFDQFLVSVLEDVQHRHQPAGGDVGQPGERLIRAAAGEFGRRRRTPSQSASIEGDRWSWMVTRTASSSKSSGPAVTSIHTQPVAGGVLGGSTATAHSSTPKCSARISIRPILTYRLTACPECCARDLADHRRDCLRSPHPLRDNVGQTSVKGCRMDLVIRNVRLRGVADPHDIGIVGDTITRIEPHVPEAGKRELDGDGGLAIPSFVDSHSHIDKSMMIYQSPPAVTGTIAESLARSYVAKRSSSVADVVARGRQALQWAVANGTGAIRVHSDVDHAWGTTGVEGLLELKQMFAGVVDLQVLVLPAANPMNDELRALVRRGMDLGADAIGGSPHLEYSPPDVVSVRGLRLRRGEGVRRRRRSPHRPERGVHVLHTGRRVRARQDARGGLRGAG